MNRFLQSWFTWRKRRRQTRGRILAVKWGYNPNSSSLGVDVTFLLLGIFAISLLTPLVALVVRTRRRSLLREAERVSDDPAVVETARGSGEG